MAVFYIILAVLAIVGITEIISIIICRFMSCNCGCSTLLITPCVNDCNYEMLVRSVIEKSKWGRLRPDKILIITEDISAQTRKDIENLIYCYPYIELCDKNDRGKIHSLL